MGFGAHPENAEAATFNHIFCREIILHGYVGGQGKMFDTPLSKHISEV